ncbi:MAG: DsbA family protein, partial [Pseudomonadales bacterium]
VARVATKQQESYLNKTFRGYWDGDLDLDSVEQIVSLLESCGGAREGFAEYCEITGRDDLAAMRSSLIERGAFTAPAFLIGGEVYVGRQHLPMVRQRLSGGRSATLI